MVSRTLWLRKRQTEEKNRITCWAHSCLKLEQPQSICTLWSSLNNVGRSACAHYFTTLLRMVRRRVISILEKNLFWNSVSGYFYFYYRHVWNMVEVAICSDRWSIMLRFRPWPWWLQSVAKVTRICWYTIPLVQWFLTSNYVPLHLGYSADHFLEASSGETRGILKKSALKGIIIVQNICSLYHLSYNCSESVPFKLSSTSKLGSYFSSKQS